MSTITQTLAPKGNDIADALDAIALTSVGVYLFMVVYNGNFEFLVAELKKETGFLEFLICLAILQWAIDNDFTGLAGPLAGLATLGVILKLSGKFDIASALKDFGSGRKGLLDTLFSKTSNAKVMTTKPLTQDI